MRKKGNKIWLACFVDVLQRYEIVNGIVEVESVDKAAPMNQGENKKIKMVNYI